MPLNVAKAADIGTHFFTGKWNMPMKNHHMMRPPSVLARSSSTYHTVDLQRTSSQMVGLDFIMMILPSLHQSRSIVDITLKSIPHVGILFTVMMGDIEEIDLTRS